MLYMQRKKTALHCANSAEITKVLVENGAEINKTEGVCVVGLRLRAWVHGMRGGPSRVCEDGASGDEGGFAKG